MRPRKTPQQKKREALAYDRVEAGEYPHADRKNRPRVKAMGKRALRRKSSILLRSADVAAGDEDTLQLPTRTSYRWAPSTVPLGEHLQVTRSRRIGREASNLFRYGYCERTHAQFRRVVESWIASNAQVLAEWLQGELHPDPEVAVWWASTEAIRRDFLERFFAREPELRQTVEGWLERQLTGSARG